eukprot:TRINITY_DN1082_c0_g1_i1.p1 TRINITY_DN1082_c0_g1~~TRINITY_DN1082_c0_g1_i1.p1  ORF type:complete len:714 (-),score=112.48 TRINITY_DN1082_c0_g1_i1:177-2258(-)
MSTVAMTQATGRQAPGGRSSLVLGPGGVEQPDMRSSNAFASGNNQNSGNVLTDRPSTALHAPPGGHSTICLGSESWASSAAATRAVSSNAFACGSSQNTGNVLSDRPSTSVHAPPGGKSSICLGAYPAEAAHTAPGSSNSFANGANQNSGNVLTDRPSTGIHAPPGGKTTICLGTDHNEWKKSSDSLTDQSAAILSAPRTERVPVGGADQIVLGAASAGPRAEELLSRASPGGQDHIVFGASEMRPTTGGAVGGSTSICLGSDAGEWQRSSSALVDQSEAIQAATASPRVPVGGQDNLVLGGDAPVSEGAECLLARSYPGGKCQIVFGASTLAVPGTGAPVGGNTTVCLGSEANDWQKSSNALPDQSEAILAAKSSPKMPIGGEDHIVLGSAAPSPGAEELLARASPGGKDQIVFGASADAPPSSGAAVGGSATVCLGNDTNDWQKSSSVLVDQSAAILTATASPRVPVGGQDNLVLGGDAPVSEGAESLLARSYPGGKCQIVFGASSAAAPGTGAPVGGDASICLGGDVNDWQKSSSALVDQSEAILAADRPSQVPIGGEDHIILGGAAAPSLEAEELLARASPGGKCSIVFGASEVCQTRNAPVGGQASVCLGDDVNDWKATSIASEKNQMKNTLAKEELSQDNAAGLKVSSMKAGAIAQDMSLPTPARNDSLAAASGRAPPGGASTVLLG